MALAALGLCAAPALVLGQPTQGPRPVPGPAAVAAAADPGEPGKNTAALARAPAEAERRIATWAEARDLMNQQQPDLQQQAAALAQAEAGVDQALSQMLPQLQLTAGTSYGLTLPLIGRDSENLPTYQQLDLNGITLVPNGTASLSVTFSIANWVAHSSARAGAEAERKALAATRHELVGTLAATLLGVVAAERIADRNRAGLTAARERLRMTERLVALGRATALDVSRFAQDLHAAQGTVVEANESLWQAREALGNALGLGEPVGVAGGFDSEAMLGPPAVSGCTSLAGLVDRADLRAAEDRARQAELAVEAARLSYLPDLQLASNYRALYQSAGLQYALEGLDLPRQLTHDWGVSANLVWTAFDGGQRAANVDASLADLAAARAQQRSVTIAVRTEARRANRLLTVALANADIARRNLEAARTADRLSRTAFELGKISALEGVDAARQLRAAEITLALRDVEVIGARVRARMALAQCR